MFSRPTKTARHSLDAKQVTPVKKQDTSGLRKEQSSPAVVQHHAGDGSLLRAVVSASGQGAQTLLHAGGSGHKALWRTRSVRNKTESYAILQLKGPSNRGVTVQVTFPDPASTPKQIRLLHGPAVNCVFKPLEAQHCITAIDSQQLQYSLQVAPNIHVQRYLKIEMQGLAVQSTATGSLHAVSQLDVVQLSALAKAATAAATELPVPAFSAEYAAPDAAGAVICDELSADVLMRSPSAHYAEGHAGIADDASSRRSSTGDAKRDAERTAAAETTAGVCRFQSWLSQTRSSLQKGMQSSTKAAAKQTPNAGQHQHRQLPTDPGQEHSVQVQQHGWLEQHEQAHPATQQQLRLQHSRQQVEATLASNRQQLLQLQSQLHRSSPNKQHTNPMVLTAAGRPSTLLSMLRHSSTLSGTDGAVSGSITCSFDSTEASQPASPSGCVPAGTGGHPEQGLASNGLQTHRVAESQAGPAGVAKQDASHSHLHPDESAVLLGSVNSSGPASSNGSCSGLHPADPAAKAAAQGYAQAAAAEGRCGSSCSVRGPAADNTAAADADQQNDQTHSEAAVAAAAALGEIALQDPQLVDSQSCLHPGGRLHGLTQHLLAHTQLSDRRVQSCPAMETSIRGSRSSSFRCSGTSSSSNSRCRLQLASGRPGSKAAMRQRARSAKSRQQSSGQMLFSPPASTATSGVKLGVMLSPEVMGRGQLVKQSCPVLTFPRYNDTHSPTKGSWEDLSAVVAAAAAGTSNAEAAADIAHTAQHASCGSVAASEMPQQLKRELFASPDHTRTATSNSAHDAASASFGSSGANTTNTQQQQQQQPGLSAAASLSSAPTGTAGATPYSATSGNNNTSVLQALLFGSSCDFGSMSDCHQLMGPALQDSATSGPAVSTAVTATAVAAATTYTAGAGAAGGWSMTYTGLMDSPGDLSAGGADGPGASSDGSAPGDFVSNLLARPEDAVCNNSPLSAQQEQQQHQTQHIAFHTPFESAAAAAAPAGDHGQETKAAAAQDAEVTPVPAAEDAVAPTPPTALQHVGGVVLSPIAESPEVSKGIIAASPGGGAEPASINSTCKTRSRTGAKQLKQAANTRQQQQQHGDEQHQDLLPCSLDGLLAQQAGPSSEFEQQEGKQHSPCMQLHQGQQQRPNAATLQHDAPQHLQALQALASSAAESDQQHQLLQELAVQSLLEVQAFNASTRAASLRSSSNGRKSNTSTPTKQQWASHQQQRNTPTTQRGPSAQQQQQAGMAGQQLMGGTPTKQQWASAVQQQQQADLGRATTAAGTSIPASPGLALRQGPRRSLSLAAPATSKKATSANPEPTNTTAAAAGTGQAARRSTIDGAPSPAKVAAARPGARSSEPYLKSPARQRQQPAARSVQSTASQGILRSSTSCSKACRPTASTTAAGQQALQATRQSTSAVTGARSASGAPAARTSLTAPSDRLVQEASASLRTSRSRMSAVRTSHVKLDLSGFNVTSNAAAAAGSGSSSQRAGSSGSSSRPRSVSSSVATAVNRSPSKPSRGASKYEQLLKSQYGAVPAVRTSQARTSMQGVATNTASTSSKTAAATASHIAQYQPLPESRSEPALGSRNASASGAAAQQQQHMQHLPECQSEPVLSSLKLANMASEESLCYIDEQLYLPTEAITAAGVQQPSNIPDCRSEPSLGAGRAAEATGAVFEPQLLLESRSEPVLSSAGGAGSQTAAAHAQASDAAAALLSHSRHWSAAELRTLSTGVRWSQKWSNENSPASSAHASPVKQHRTASMRQHSSAWPSGSNLGSSQCTQLSTDEPAQQLRQAVQAVQALVQHSSRRLEPAGPSKQQPQQQQAPAQDRQLQGVTPPRELSQQQQEIAAAAIRSGKQQQSPASPEAQTNFFLPKLLQPQLLTPQTAEPMARGLARGMAGGRTADLAVVGLAGLTSTPPGLGLASPISASKQQRRELQQDQDSFAFQTAEHATAQQQQRQCLQQQLAAHRGCTSPLQSDQCMQGGDVELSSPVSLGAGVTGAATADDDDVAAALDTAAGNRSTAAGSCAMRAASPSELLLDVAGSSCSPVARRVLQPKARSCQLIANRGTQGANTEAIAASYKLLQNVGAISADGLSLCSHSAAAGAAPAGGTAADSTVSTSFGSSKAGSRNTIVVSIEKHTHGVQQQPVQVQQTYQLESHCIAEIVQLEAAPGAADSICTSCSMGHGAGVAAASACSVAGDLQIQQHEVGSELLESRLAQQQLDSEEAVGAAHSPCGALRLQALSAAAAEPCSSSLHEEQAAGIVALAADSDGTDSVQSYCTASSQMGTVWPHNSPERLHHQHQELQGAAAGSDNMAGSIDTRHSSSSVSDTGLQHLRASSMPQGPGASGVLRISSDDDEHVGGVHLARNFYQRAAQRPASAQQSGCTSRQQLQRQGSQQSCGHSSAAMHLHHPAVQRSAAAARATHNVVSPEAQTTESSEHSLWDETDPLAAEVSSVAANATGAVQGSSMRASHQQDDPPHRVRPGMRSSKQDSASLRNSAGIRSFGEAGHRPGSRTGAAATGRGLLKEGSGRSILAGAAAGGMPDNESDVASQNEAPSASSGVGPSRLPGTAAAAAAAPQYCLSDLQDAGETSAGLQYIHVPQQQQMQETGSSLSFAAMSKQQRSPSPSTAAMLDGSCSGIHAAPAAAVAPGPIESSVAADVAQNITGAVAETGTLTAPATSTVAAQASAPAATATAVARADSQPTAASPATRISHGSVSSSCASASGMGGGMLTLEVSMNDLGVGEQQRFGPYRCSKDQSPSKSPVKDRSSPTRLRGSKAGAMITAAAPDQAGPDSYLDDDVESVASSQESYAGKRPVKLQLAADQGQHASSDENANGNSRHRPAVAQQPADAPAVAGVLASPLRSRMQQTKQLQVTLPSSPQVQRRSAMCFSPLHAARSAGGRGSLVLGGGTPGKPAGPGLLEAAVSQQASAVGVQAASGQPPHQSKAAAGAADGTAVDENQSQASADHASHTKAAADGGTPAASAGAAESTGAAGASPYKCFAPLHSMLGSGSGRRSSKTQTRVKQEALGAAEGEEEVTGVRKNLMVEMVRAADGAIITAGYVAAAAPAATAEQPDTNEVRDSAQRSGALSGSAADAVEHSSTGSSAKPQQQHIQRLKARPHTAGSLLGKTLNMPTIGVSPGAKARQQPATSQASCSSSSAGAGSRERQQLHASLELQPQQRRTSDSGSNSTVAVLNVAGSQVPTGAAATPQTSETNSSISKASSDRHAAVSDSIQLMSHSNAAAMLRAAAATPAPIPNPMAQVMVDSGRMDDGSTADVHKLPHAPAHLQQTGKQGLNTAMHTASAANGPAATSLGPRAAPTGSSSTNSAKQQQQRSQAAPQSRIPAAPGAAAACAAPTAPAAAAAAAGPLSSGLRRRGNSAGSLPRMFGAAAGGRPSSPGAAAGRPSSPAAVEHVATAASSGNVLGATTAPQQQQQQQHRRPHSPVSSDLTVPSSVGSAVGCQQQQQRPRSRGGVHAEGPSAQHSQVLSGRAATKSGGQQGQGAEAATAAALPNNVSSPYLQQLEEHSTHQQQQQQQQLPAASPLSSHRHNLQLKAVPQQSSPAKPAPEVSSPVLGSSPPLHFGSSMRPASCLGYAPGTQTAQVRDTGSFTGEAADGTAAAAAAAAATTPPAVAVASPQLLGPARRFSSTGGGAAAAGAAGNAGDTVAGLSPVAGATRVGRFRHRRTKSDMPELYQPLLSPLESPLHAAMPEDHSDSDLAMLAAAAEASGTGEWGGPIVAGQSGAAAAAAAAGRLTPQHSALQMGCVPTDMPTSPLGSPLRHGLTSAAAMYRLQQQQLQRETSAAGMQQQQQQQVEAGDTAEVAAALTDLGPSEPELTLKPQQEGIVQAIAAAVAGYEGSMSPRRLARIQEYISGLASVDLGTAASPTCLKATGLAESVAGTPLGKESDALDSFNLNNHMNIQAELKQQQQQQRQALAETGGNDLSDETPLTQKQQGSGAAAPTAASARSSTTSSRPQASGEAAPNDQQRQLHHESNYSSNHSEDQPIHSRSSSHASCHSMQQQQCQAATAADAAGFDGPWSSALSSLPSASSEDLLHALAAAAGASGLQGSALLGSLQALPDMPALLAASAETLDIQPSENGLSWKGSRLSHDSQQDAVMQSQGALLGPGPGSHSQGQLHEGDAADNTDGAVRPGLVTRGPPGPATAAGMFRRSAHLLAGFAQQMWGPHAVGSIESTAGSNAVGALSRGGASRGMMGVRGSTGSLSHGVQLVHEMAASVEHLAASLDITGPQALQLTKQLLLQQLVGQQGSAQQDEQHLTCTTSAAGTAGQQSSRQDQTSKQQEQQQRVPGHAPSDVSHPRPQLGPLLAGRLAALAALRQLRRSSVGESPDVIEDSRAGLGSSTNAGKSVLAGAIAAAGLGLGRGSAGTAGAAASSVRGSSAAGILGRSRSTSAGTADGATTARGRTAMSSAGGQQLPPPQQQGPMGRQLSAQRQQPQQHVTPLVWQRSSLGGEGSFNGNLSGSRSRRSSCSGGGSRY